MSRLGKLSIVVASFTIASIGSIVMYKSIKTREQEEINLMHWESKVEYFKQTAIDSTSIVFLGNSLTERFDLGVFNNRDIVNRGISGDITAGVLLRLDEIVNSRPKKILIEIGTNDLLKKIPAVDILKNYGEIINGIRKASPGTQIYIQSIPPMDISSFFISNEKINERVKEVNEGLKKKCKAYNLTYIDLHSKFILNDKLNPEYSLDGVHLTGKAYKVWQNAIENYITE